MSDIIRIITSVIGGLLGLIGIQSMIRKKNAEKRRENRKNAKPQREITERNIGEISRDLQKVFLSGKTKSLEWRRNQLYCLLDLVEENKEQIIKAVALDLGKKPPYQEILVSEINLIIHEIHDAIDHLSSWVSPIKVYTPISAQPATSSIRSDPLGVVLVISPWNYPVNLALAPLVGAVAAGNCALVKLSRHSENTAKLLSELIPKYMDQEAILAEGKGGASFLTETLKHKWDHIFFTGSVSVGKVVAKAAADYLTPCTLELGGKNPCVVLADADLKLAARRIAWGKLFNAGQTCLGVDYVLVEDAVHDRLVEELKAQITAMYGKNPKESNDLPRIISKDHVERLSKTFACGKVVFGGEVDVNDKYVAPTLIVNPKLDSVLMTDEIFGPVLPIVKVSNVDAAVDFMNARPHPLAMYVFTSTVSRANDIISRTRSGAALINEVLLHFTNSALPFGGVGDSGCGRYHGKFTFDTLTHKRAVITSTSKSWLDLPLRYAPYSTTVAKIVNFATSLGGW